MSEKKNLSRLFLQLTLCFKYVYWETNLTTRRSTAANYCIYCGFYM